MVWDVPDYQWEEGYAAAVRYHKEHGDLNVAQKYVDSSGFRLGAWLGTQRDNEPDRRKPHQKLGCHYL